MDVGNESNFTSTASSQVNKSHPCSEKNWDPLIALSLSGGVVALSCVIVALSLQLWISRHLLHLALKIKLQLHVCTSIFITLVIFLIDDLPRDENLSSATCQALGSLFHLFLLSSFFWLATEPFVSWLDVRATINRTALPKRLLLWANIINWGVPLLIVIIVHTISATHENLYGMSINITQGNSIKRQFCWFENNTALLVTMVIPAAILWFGEMVVSVSIEQQCRSLRLQRPSISRLLLPAVFGPMWVFGGLSVIDLSSSRSDTCEPLVAYSGLFCTGCITFGLLVCWQHGISAWEMRDASKAEQGRKKLIFKEKRPSTLGSDGLSSDLASPSSVTSQETMNTTVSAQSLLPFRGKVQKPTGYVDETNGKDFEQIVSSLPTLPPQFTLKPHGEVAHDFPESTGDKTASLKTASILGSSNERKTSQTKSRPEEKTFLHAPEEVLGKSRSTSDVFFALPDVPLDKSSSAVDIIRVSPSGDSEPCTTSLPNVITNDSHTSSLPSVATTEPAVMLPTQENDVIRWNPMFDVEDKEYGKRNLSFDELEESDEDREVATVKANSLPAINIDMGTPARQRASSLSKTQAKSQTLHEGARKVTSLKARSSQTAPGVIRSHSSRSRRERTKREEAHRRAAARRVGQSTDSLQAQLRQIHLRDTPWQSSGVESNESDLDRRGTQFESAQPSKQELPAEEEDQPQARPRRNTGKKTFEEQGSRTTSPETYLEAHNISQPSRREHKSQRNISPELKDDEKVPDSRHESPEHAASDDLPRTQSTRSLAERKLARQRMAQAYWQQYGQYPQYGGPYPSYGPYQQYTPYGGGYGMPYPMQYAPQPPYSGYYGYNSYYGYYGQQAPVGQKAKHNTKKSSKRPTEQHGGNNHGRHVHFAPPQQQWMA